MPANNKTYAVFYEHPQLQGDGTHKDVVLAEIFIMGNQNTMLRGEESLKIPPRRSRFMMRMGSRFSIREKH